jgi:hypothetical protein
MLEYRSGLLQGYLVIFEHFVMVFCGEVVVVCVADVAFWQSVFAGKKIRQLFCKIF